MACPIGMFYITLATGAQSKSIYGEDLSHTCGFSSWRGKKKKKETVIVPRISDRNFRFMEKTAVLFIPGRGSKVYTAVLMKRGLLIKMDCYRQSLSAHSPLSPLCSTLNPPAVSFIVFVFPQKGSHAILAFHSWESIWHGVDLVCFRRNNLEKSRCWMSCPYIMAQH